MRGTRYLRIALLLAAVLVAAAGCRPRGKEARKADLLRRIDAALLSSGRYMISKQSKDGAWRSEHYGSLRDGPELTPYVMSYLFFVPDLGEAGRRSYRKGVDYLAGMVGKDGKVKLGPRGLNFPVYTAASASRVVKLQERSERNMRAHRAWLAYVRARQLNAALGWKKSDPEFGGWGFSLAPPRKPKRGELRGRFVESNLSATIFGIAALRSAKVPAADPGFRDALVFAKRCQNFTDDPSRRDERYDDGGFFFMPGDALQNKAGVAGKDRSGRRRFSSYGSMTADGVRALIRCGLPRNHPRVVAARRWLEHNFSARINPGRFASDREVLRNATYYYWAWAVAHAFMGLRLEEIQTPKGKLRWAEALAGELLRRQEPDGTWVNRRFTDAKEDDPLVATPWAAAALAICRGVISGHGPGHPRGHPTLGKPAGRMQKGHPPSRR
jgi:squalene-hopene/tetraprenyl-beta-curcumene cyclase